MPIRITANVIAPWAVQDSTGVVLRIRSTLQTLADFAEAARTRPRIALGMIAPPPFGAGGDHASSSSFSSSSLLLLFLLACIHSRSRNLDFLSTARRAPAMDPDVHVLGYNIGLTNAQVDPQGTGTSSYFYNFT